MQAPKLFLDLCCKKQDPPHCNSPPLHTKRKIPFCSISNRNLSTVVGCLSLASIFFFFFFFFCPISGDANLHHPPPIAASFWCYFYLHPEFCNLVSSQVDPLSWRTAEPEGFCMKESHGFTAETERSFFTKKSHGSTAATEREILHEES